jgi:sugar lactone lactonase YvrE
MTIVLALFGCDGQQGDGPGGDPVAAGCDTPGQICRWLGIPGSGAFSAEGTDRSAHPLTGTMLYFPTDLTFAADGTAFYADHNNHRIRRVGTDDIVTTVSGTGMVGDGPNLPGSVNDCWDGCPALDSAWNHPTSVAVGDHDSLWVAARDNSRVNRVDLPTETMFWWADQLELPTSVAVADDGTVYVSETGAAVIRRISPDGLVETIAGAPDVVDPRGLFLDGDLLWFADGAGAIVGWIDVAACATDASACLVGFVYGDASDWTEPNDVAVGLHGDVYVADAEGSCVHVIRTDGTDEVFAGQCGSSGYAGDEGPATEALFENPSGVAVDAAGNVYVADSSNHVIRRIVPLP